MGSLHDIIFILNYFIPQSFGFFQKKCCIRNIRKKEEWSVARDANARAPHPMVSCWLPRKIDLIHILRT